MALVVFQLNMYVLCKHECANYASCIGIPSLYEDFTQGPIPNYQLLTLKLDFLIIGIYILFWNSYYLGIIFVNQIHKVSNLIRIIVNF